MREEEKKFKKSRTRISSEVYVIRVSGARVNHRTRGSGEMSGPFVLPETYFLSVDVKGSSHFSPREENVLG